MRHFVVVIAVVAVRCLLFNVAEAAPITSGTGPGGVGTTDGSSNLELWFRGDQGVTETATVITQWDDQSGNGVHGTQSDPNRQPEFISAGSGLNNRPLVRFNSAPLPTNSNSDLLDLSYSHAASDYTFFYTIRPGTQQEAAQAWLFDSNSSTRLIPAFRANDGADGSPGYFNGSFHTVTEPALAGDPAQIMTFRFEDSGSGAGAELFRNATALTFGNNSYSPLPYDGTNVGFPRNSAGNNLQRTFDGDFGDFALFDRAVNSAERMIVENYMSAKYNVGETVVGSNNTLGTNDRYAGDLDTNGDHDFDVFGVGRVDAANEFTNSGTAGFGIEATGNLGDGEFVMAGHDGLSPNIVPVGTVGIVGDRFGRTWFVDETGEVDVTLAFDFSDLGETVPLDAESFSLLFSSPGGPLNFVPIADGVLNGDVVTFDLAGTSLVDGLYTLGINVEVPEPSSGVLVGIGLVAVMRNTRRRRRGR